MVLPPCRYEAKYNEPLIDRICSEVGGDYQKFLVALLRCERQEGAAADAGLAGAQCEQMHNAAKGWGCDKAVFIDILAKASEQQIDAIQVRGDPPSSWSCSRSWSWTWSWSWSCLPSSWSWSSCSSSCPRPCPKVPPSPPRPSTSACKASRSRSSSRTR